MTTKNQFIAVKKLLTKKGREESGQFIIEGWKSVEEALNAGMKIDVVMYDAMRVENPRLISRLILEVEKIFPVKAKELETISDTVTSQGIIAVVPQFDTRETLEPMLTRPELLMVALDEITDPGNLGTIIRTCDWFGVDALLVGSHSVDVYNPKVVRATMGSLFHLTIFEGVNLSRAVRSCRANGVTVYTSELKDSIDIRKVTYAQKSMICIGNESRGISSELSNLADMKITIPPFGKAESLNAAMACGIILAQIKL